jgi:tetratricopeptide (TPR) repeat protein
MPDQLERFSHRRLAGALAIAGIILAVAWPLHGEQALSPAEQRMAWAAKQIAAHPDDPQPYVDLGWALARRSRETGDPAYYAKAQEEATRSLALAPGNFEARKLEVWLLLGRHDFGPALAAAKALNQQAPDDVMIYGFLADANAELGEYKAAEDAVQWMLDMRPGNLSGLTRAAYLREIFGDLDGAIELYTTAFNRMALTEVEDRAWILSQVGHLYLSKGSTAEAGQALEQALALVPGYHYALGYLAHVRLAEKRGREAVKLLRQLCDAAPHAENVYALAEALHHEGSPDARAAYAEFERKALAESATRDNANRELVFYYVDRRRQSDDARRIAEIERAARHDVHTLDAYAWALSAAGDHEKAWAEIDQALAVGTRDAVVLYHAGIIASRLHDLPAAQRFLTQSLEVSSVSPVAEEARSALSALPKTARAAHLTDGGVAR